MIRERIERLWQIKNRLLNARSRQKSYADVRRKPLEFKVGDKVMLKVSPWKGVVAIWKTGKLCWGGWGGGGGGSPRYKFYHCSRFVSRGVVVLFFREASHMLQKICRFAVLPESSRIHNTFHVSNLKKCLSDEDLVIPLDEIRIDEKLHFIEEQIEIVDKEEKQLKQSRIPIVKVRWNSKRGPEYTWEREAHIGRIPTHLDINKKRQEN
ncbi:hypothetical protein Tco_1067451 [Tanacetum coccineum]|uniref:Reverse transcriptase domain-containing protein n=1 Tax=Tanacetum coccineum TaxID=301880 RepID=A0ABQ5HCW7_9ASTR